MTDKYPLTDKEQALYARHPKWSREWRQAGESPAAYTARNAAAHGMTVDQYRRHAERMSRS